MIYEGVILASLVLAGSAVENVKPNSTATKKDAPLWETTQSLRVWGGTSDYECLNSWIQTGPWMAVKFSDGALQLNTRRCETLEAFGAESDNAAAEQKIHAGSATPKDGDWLRTTATSGTLGLSTEPLGLEGADFQARRIFVYLPPGYTQNALRHYPVVYLHDGQNLWDDKNCCFGHGGWFLNAAMDEMATAAHAILVGIPNSSARMQEYGLGKDIMDEGGPNDTDYLRYLREVVKPHIDHDFRTLPGPAHTTVMGSSMGGLVSLLAAFRNPEVFGNCAAMSTAFQIKDAKGQGLADLLNARGKAAFRLYLDSGTAGPGKDGMERTREFARLALQKQWQTGEDFKHVEAQGAEHNEKAWRMRASAALRFILREPLVEPEQ